MVTHTTLEHGKLNFPVHVDVDTAKTPVLPVQPRGVDFAFLAGSL